MQTSSPPEKTATGLDRTLFGIRNRHLFALDLLTFCVTPILALWLRIENWNAIWRYADALLVYILIAGILRFIIFRPFGLYSRYWRYASVDELAQIFFAVFVSSFTVIVIFFGLAVLPLESCLTVQSRISNLESRIPNLESVLCPLSSLLSSLSALPRSVPFLDSGLALIAVGGSRFSVRLMERYRQRGRKHAATTKRVAIIGAGSAGTMIAKEMQNNPQLGLEPVVFLDDDPRKHGMVIRGIRVVGDGQFICNAVDEYRIQQAIIAMPTAAGKTIRELTHLCRNANIPVQTVPGIFELLDGSVTVNQLRPVDITDLLRRESVVADITGVFRWLEGRRVLVTGAGGSIGGELCRQIARCNPAELVLLGHGENSIFDIYNELRRAEVGSGKLEVGSEKVEVGSGKLEVGSERPISNIEFSTSHLPLSTSDLPLPTSHFFPVIADIRDECRMQSVFERYQPEIVFHAGAHKHVPLMEENAADAITNNVLGTRNLLRCAAAYGVEHLVLISSDKAVNPTSVMGTTKRIAELLVHEAAVQTGRCYVAVRFGNVLGSRGSVIPFFKQQIAQGGPVTVTHPDVTRYFMTIPEAVELVLQAATMGKVGDVFVLDMGEPIKIVDLARDLIRLSGLEVGQDIEIEYTGLRPGEKLFEELFISEENCAGTSHEKIFVVRNGLQLPTSHFPLPTSNFQLQVDDLIATARSGNEGEIRRKLKEIVPEYQPPSPPEEAVAVPPVVDVVPPEREAVPSERALVFRVAGAEGD